MRERSFFFKKANTKKRSFFPPFQQCATKEMVVHDFNLLFFLKTPFNFFQFAISPKILPNSPILTTKYSGAHPLGVYTNPTKFFKRNVEERESTAKERKKLKKS